MSTGIAESHVEEATLAWLAELGYETASGVEIGPDGIKPERAAYADVVLEGRLREAIARLNPDLAAEARGEILRKLMQAETPALVEENRRLHRYLIEGVPIEITREDGSVTGELVRLVDFEDPTANDWLAVNQVTVIENKAKRRLDGVLFVNGLPLGVIELKNPGDENATLDGAFNQLQTYKSQIPSVFRNNAALVISDGLGARIGSLTADRERFMPWCTVEGDDLAPRGTRNSKRLSRACLRSAGSSTSCATSSSSAMRERGYRRSSPAITSSMQWARPWRGQLPRPGPMATAKWAWSGIRKARAKAC